MAKLVPLLKKRAPGRGISGLNAYEQGSCAMTVDKSIDPVVPKPAVSRVSRRWRAGTSSHSATSSEPITERVGIGDVHALKCQHRHRSRESRRRSSVAPSLATRIRTTSGFRLNDFAYNKSATKEFPQGYIARYSGTKDAAVPKSIFTCFRPDYRYRHPGVPRPPLSQESPRSMAAEVHHDWFACTRRAECQRQ